MSAIRKQLWVCPVSASSGNWIIKLGGVNQYEPGESYTKLYFFFKLNENHSYIPLKVGMKSLVK